MKYNTHPHRPVYTYTEYTDDVVTNSGQHTTLPDDYRYRHGLWWHMVSAVIYALFIPISWIYCRAVLRVHFRGLRTIRKCCHTSGCFVYANHTQPVGDAFALICLGLGRRIHAVVSPANLGIPFLGRLIPFLGALPTPSAPSGIQRFTEAIYHGIAHRRPIFIYPEAHVWPYYTAIRPFPDTSMRYPVQCGVPVYVMTTTYKQPRRGVRPRITIYIDGPYMPDTTLSPREARRQLHATVMQAMQSRAAGSDYQYAEYQCRKTE